MLRSLLGAFQTDDDWYELPGPANWWAVAGGDDY